MVCVAGPTRPSACNATVAFALTAGDGRAQLARGDVEERSGHPVNQLPLAFTVERRRARSANGPQKTAMIWPGAIGPPLKLTALTIPPEVMTGGARLNVTLRLADAVPAPASVARTANGSWPSSNGMPLSTPSPPRVLPLVHFP